MRIEQLESQIRELRYFYYNQPEALTISDSEFDFLVRELEKLKPDSPVLKEIGSPPKENQIRHLQKMYSLDNAMNDEEFEKWMNKISIRSKIITASVKMDGASAELIYKDGLLISTSTRGDGIIGEYSSQIRAIVPNEIPAIGLIQVVGEVVINKEEWSKSNGEYSSPRNLAAGSLMVKDDDNILKKRGAKFYAFAVNNLEKPMSHYDQLLTAVKLGIPVVPYTYGSVLDYKKFYQTFLDQREEIYKSYGPADGVVFRVDDHNYCANIGYSEKAPKFAIAYKFPAEEKITTIKKIRWDISKNGILTPVAEIKPVIIEGAIISNVTLHNMRNLVENNLGEGAKISIIRSGGVIPKFLKTLKGVTPVVPIKCPSCDSFLTNDGVRLYCPDNNKFTTCIPQLVDFIASFLDRLEYKGLAEKSIEKLIKANVVGSVSHLFTLPVTTFEDVLGYKHDHALDTRLSLNKLKEVNFDKFLYACNFDMVGKTYSKKIAREMSWDEFKVALFNDNPKLLIYVSSIFGAGSETTNRIMTDFYYKGKDLIKSLLGVGFKIRDNKKKEINSLNIVVTGTLSMPRKEIQKIIEEKGHIFQSSLTKDTNFLVCGINTGQNKKIKAEKYGTKLINEEELMELL